ncbi:RNA-directed DNA polymerase, eukaryota [Tanacetum coccineum]
MTTLEAYRKLGNIYSYEIKDAIWDCGSDKSPGPDGFTFAFYKTFWDTIKEDVVGSVQHFFNIGILPCGCNTSFIALIPKVPNPMLISDFRHMSLVGDHYKIIAKILANRLARVIDFVISQEQSAFIKHREILDRPLMINEVIQWSKRKKAKKNFWGGDDSYKKIPWISWNLALASKEKGGLGIGSLYSLNHARLIVSIHGISEDVSSFFSHVRNQAELIMVLQQNSGMTHSWRLDWSRHISSGTNANHLASLYNLLSDFSLNDSEDTWIWSFGTSTFTVKSIREHNDHCSLPKKINIFNWRVLRDRLPSRWNLSRKGVDVVSLSCPVCDCGIETIHHSLWFCSLATIVWN